MAGKIRKKTTCVCLLAIRYETREGDSSVRPTHRSVWPQKPQ